MQVAESTVDVSNAVSVLSVCVLQTLNPAFVVVQRLVLLVVVGLKSLDPELKVGNVFLGGKVSSELVEVDLRTALEFDWDHRGRSRRHRSV